MRSFNKIFSTSFFVGLFSLLTSCFDPGWPSGSCFLAGTEIYSPDGSKSVEDMLPGDTVYAYDVEKNEVVSSVIEELITKEDQSYLKFSLSSGESLSITLDHPVAVRKNGHVKWVEAGKLTKNSELVFLEGGLSVSAGKIEAIEEIRGSVTVYNLKMRRYENVFSQGVLTRVYTHDQAQTAK